MPCQSHLLAGHFLLRLFDSGYSAILSLLNVSALAHYVSVVSPPPTLFLLLSNACPIDSPAGKFYAATMIVGNCTGRGLCSSGGVVPRYHDERREMDL
jgi:hypothetical protein